MRGPTPFDAIHKFVLTLTLIFGTFGWTNSVRAASPELEPVINVQIDAADMPPNRDALARVVEAELARRLAEQREQLPSGVFVADDRRVIVELWPSPIPDSDDVLMHVIVELDGERLAETSTEPCLACSDVDVATRVMKLMLPLLAELPGPAPTESAAPEPTLAEPAEQPAEGLEWAPAGQKMVISGGVLIGVGLVGVGVGAGLIAVDERLVSDPHALDLEFVKYREVGIATLALGGAAAVTGAVLLGLGLRERSHSRVAVAPVFGPRGWGVTFTGSF